MPSSVLLAILVGAGVLALMPALVRRYDAVVRGQAELHTSSMRVLLRRRRRRTVPGSAPINPPSFLGARNPARAMGRATVPDALTPGDAESDALVRAALVRDALEQDAAKRARQRTAERTQQLTAASRPGGPAPVSGGMRKSHSQISPEELRSERAGVAGRSAAAPGVSSRPVRRAMVEASQLQQWRRYRRRRVLFAFSLLFVAQTAGALVIGPGFWAGAAVAAVLTLAYLVRLRAATAAERRQLATERARRHRAYEFVRVATRNSRVDEGAVARTAAWLSTPRDARRRPSREVARVLILAGREAVQGADGTWAVRRAPEPTPGGRRPVLPRTTARPASRNAGAPARTVDEPLRRAVNS
jgi:hypothetical protein